MSAIAQTGAIATPTERSIGILRRLGAVMLAMVLFVPRLLRNRREINLLVEADDAMLRDIGLTRQDVAAALSEPLWRDPSERLTDLSSERRTALRAQARDRLYPGL